ncbi:MAG: radical SAM protein [Firmicutes bacterium]|nr:radical SAM protein [Bacillota bacterium]
MVQIKKIALIEPQSKADHVYSFVQMPRLGLPLLGSLLKAEGYEVEIYLGRGDRLPWTQILQADLVGISTTTSTSREAYCMAGYVRSHGLPVVIGGIHATLMPEEALTYADYVVRGEGEQNFLRLIHALEEERSPEGIPGVSYWDQGEAVHNPDQRGWIDVEQFPVADLSLYKPQLNGRTLPVLTSRGCPHNCTFCCVTVMFGRRYRFRSKESVLDELTSYRGKNVFFCDDNFTANRRHSKELLQGMIDRKINLRSWGAQIRAEAVRDDELLDLMYRSGCRIVYVGLESINPATLEAYQKNQSVDDIKQLIHRCHDYGIKVHGMFIFGADTDTVQTLRDTVDFSLESRIDSVQYMILTPLPGTPLYKQLEDEGRLLTKDWELYDGHHVVYQPAQMSSEQLSEETIKAYKRFYSLNNIFKNVALTGFGSAVFRGIGWWMVRRFERKDRWFDPVLERLGDSSPSTTPLLYKRIPLLKRPAAIISDQSLRIFITEKKGVIYLRVKGFMDRLALKELKRTIRRLVPRNSFHVVLNMEGLSFASEKAGKLFSGFLGGLAERVRRLQVVARKEDHILPRIKESSHRFKLPRFEVVLSRR